MPVAIPESTKKSKVCLEISLISRRGTVAKTIPHAINKMTTVLMAVAKLELTPLTPTFAKIAVSAAKKADNNAYVCHMKTLSQRHVKFVNINEFSLIAIFYFRNEK